LRRGRRGSADHQSGYRSACFHAQFAVGNLRLQAGGGELLLDVNAGVAVAAVQFKAVAGAAGRVDGPFQREQEHPVWTQRPGGRREDLRQIFSRRRSQLGYS
jgi:hypothetical protein